MRRWKTESKQVKNLQGEKIERYSDCEKKNVYRNRMRARQERENEKQTERER